jgi:uncharacterized membrane protein YiaA
MKKTYKRETAWALMVALLGLLVWGVFEPDAMRAAEMIVFPVFGFVSLAFGMDAYSKQIMGGPEV